MDQREHVSADTASLGGDDSLGGDAGYCGVYRVASRVEDVSRRFGREMVRSCDRVLRQDAWRSGRTLLSASRTALTTARVSSSST